MLRLVHALLLLTCGVAAAAALFLTLALVYSVEPTSFVWRAIPAGSDIREANEIGEGATSASEVACEPIILPRAAIGIGSVADFATEAVIAINTYDYLDWDSAIPNALNTYFTSRAARTYFYQFGRSRLLRTVQNSYYTVSALNIRPAMVVGTTDSADGRTWTVQVPVTLRYQTGVTTADGGRTAHDQTELFTVKILEQRPNRQNFRGVAINDITNETVRVIDDLDRLE